MSCRVAAQLVFSPDVAARVTALAASLSAFASPQFVLGDQTPPHITLFSCEMPVFSPAYFTDDAGIEVEFSGGCALGAQSPMQWAAISVPKTPQFENLRQRVLHQLSAGADNMARFLPHVTVAQVHEKHLAAVLQLINDSPTAHIKNINCRFEWAVFCPQTGYRRYNGQGTAL